MREVGSSDDEGLRAWAWLRAQGRIDGIQRLLAVTAQGEGIKHGLVLEKQKVQQRSATLTLCHFFLPERDCPASGSRSSFTLVWLFGGSQCEMRCRTSLLGMQLRQAMTTFSRSYSMAVVEGRGGGPWGGPCTGCSPTLIL